MLYWAWRLRRRRSPEAPPWCHIYLNLLCYWLCKEDPPVDATFTRTIPAHPLTNWSSAGERMVDKRPRCITGQRSQGDFRTVASSVASTPHWGGHLSPSAPLPLPSLFPLFHPTPAPNILGPTVTIQPGVDQCKTHNIKAAYFWKCVCVTVRAFHGWRINLASLLGSPPIFCRSTRFCSEMTNGGFSLFGFYSRGRGSSRWLSAKSDQFRKWAELTLESQFSSEYCCFCYQTLTSQVPLLYCIHYYQRRGWGPWLGFDPPFLRRKHSKSFHLTVTNLLQSICSTLQ